MHDVAAIQALIAPLFPGLMGVRVTELADDRVVAEMPVRADLCTAGGILHGGAYMAFADTLGAIGTLVNLGLGKRTTTTDSSTKFIAARRHDGRRRIGGAPSRPHDDGLADLGPQRRRQAVRARHPDPARSLRRALGRSRCHAA
jgi:uncharacterized protein (TIGR00369 family)